jgi:Integrase core domain
MNIGETSVSKYLVRHRKPPSQTWRTFLENHVKNLVSVDFFTVPTLRFQVLYVFLVLAHDRRRILHFGVTAHPTAEWTAQQLREAFPWDIAPRYLLRDRDRIFGDAFSKQVQDMAIQEVLSAPRSPWQRAYVERVIGTIRRECLDHVIVFNEASLYRHVKSFVTYYHESRTHLSLGKDSPESRAVQPPELGRIVAIPQVGGLHHRYERRAAGNFNPGPCATGTSVNRIDPGADPRPRPTRRHATLVGEFHGKSDFGAGISASWNLRDPQMFSCQMTSSRHIRRNVEISRQFLNHRAVATETSG